MDYFLFSNVIQDLSIQPEFLKKLDTTPNGPNEPVNILFIRRISNIRFVLGRNNDRSQSIGR